MKIFTKILTAGILMIGLLGVFTPVVSAANGIDICSNGNENSVYCKNKGSGETQVNGIIKTIVEVLLTAVWCYFDYYDSYWRYLCLHFPVVTPRKLQKPGILFYMLSLA